MTSVLTLHGTDMKALLSNYLDTNDYETVELTRAFIPLAYYNVSQKLQNNYITVAQLGVDNKYTNETTISFQDGFYSVNSLNDTLQKALHTKNINGISFTYLQDQGRIQIHVKRPYALYLHPALCDLLGVTYRNVMLTDKIEGDKPPRFTPHTRYQITCNLVNESKNLFNGSPSKVLATLQPKNGEYGDSFTYKYGVKVPIRKSGYSNVEVDICDVNLEKIKFHEPVTIILTLNKNESVQR